MRHHRWQPTRLPRPWDSPGKNTGVGCHFLLQCRKVKSESEVIQRPHGLQPTRLLRPWDFPGKSTGVGCQCLLRSEQLQRRNRTCCNTDGPGRHCTKWMCQTQKTDSTYMRNPESSNSERQKRGFSGAGEWREEVGSFSFAKWKTPGGWLGEQNTIELCNINGLRW